MKEELRAQCMELIYQGWDKEKIVKFVEEIYDDLQGREEKP